MKEELNNVNKIPGSFKEALWLAYKKEEENERLREQNAHLEYKVTELQPASDYCNIILSSTSLLTTTDVASDYGMSAKKFNIELAKLKIQFKRSGKWYLYSEYNGKGYSKIKTYAYDRPDGTVGTKESMYWTQKGRLFLYNLLKENGIIPLIEQQQAEQEDDNG